MHFEFCFNNGFQRVFRLTDMSAPSLGKKICRYDGDTSQMRMESSGTEPQ